jgi:integrase
MTAEGSVYQRKDGRWVAQYGDAKDKVRYIYRKSRGEAKKALRDALRDRDEGYVPAEKLTVGLYLDGWMEERRNTVSGRTWRVQESMLCKLTPADVRGMYRRLLSDGLTPSTVGNVHVILKQAIRDAVRDKHIRSNPLDDVKPPKQQRKEKDVLTAEDVRRLLETVRGGRFKGVFVLAATCGLRIGEILALRYEDVDLERGTVRIERTLHEGECSAPKTSSSRRTLSLPHRALEALVRHRGGRNNPTGYLFATASGKPVDVSNFYRWSWRPALKRAGLPETLTPHQLRHGTASLLLNQNVPVPVVSRYLGHANPGVTMKVYAHMIDGTSGMAADGIDEALG